MKRSLGGLTADVFQGARKTLAIATMAATIAAGLSGAARASSWAGGSADWNSNANPGWNGTGVPNAVGAVAENNAIALATTTIQQNVPGGTVTIGSLLFGGTNNFAWTHTLTNPIIFNQDGTGSGVATIANSNTNTGTGNALILSNPGTITLADDLLVINTGGSTNATGAIQINGTVSGTGNVTLSNISTAIAQAGSIRFQTGVNTFTGNVLVRNGTTTFNVATSLGAATNVITLGESGQSAAALLSTTNVTMANPIVVAAGTTGSLTLGTVSTSASALGFSGPITLNGNLSLTGATTTATALGANLSGIISGIGGITKIGAGIATLSNSLNSYTGDTVVSTGTLVSTNAIPDGPGKGNLIVNSGATFSLNSNDVVNGLSGGGTVTSISGTRILSIGGNNQSSTFTGTFTNGTGGITKIGSGIFTLQSSAASTYTGNTRLNFNGGTLRLDYANMATPTNMIPGSATNTLQMSSGTLEIVGRMGAFSTSQTFNALNMNVNVGHDNTILLSPNGGTGTSLTITSPTITRIPGNSINFAVGSGSGTADFKWGAANLNGSILGGFALFNGNTWAVGDGTNITGLASGAYTTTTTNGNTASNYLSTQDIDVTSSPVLDGGITVNSVRFNTPGANTLTLTGTNVISSGGLLVTSAVGNNPTVITGGTLTGTASVSAGSQNGLVLSATDLIVHQFNTSNILDISSVITDGSGITALTKNGAGTLKLSANNTYTGETFVANGKVVINSPDAIPHGSGKGNVSVNGILDLNGNSITVNNFDVRPAGTLTNTGGGNVTLTMGESSDTAAFIFNTGATVQDGNGVLSINKIGTGAFTAQAQVTYSGGTTLSNGSILLADDTTPASGTVTSGPLGTGTLTLAGGTLAPSSAVTRTFGNNIFVAPATTTALNTNTANTILVLTGAMTGTGTVTNVTSGTANTTTNFQGDLSGFHGTFNYFTGTGTNSWTFDGTTPGSYDASHAKFDMTGTIIGSNRTIRIGGGNSPPVFKIGELNGLDGRVAGNAAGGGVTIEVGHLNTPAAYGGIINTNSVDVMNFRKVGTNTQVLSGISNYNGTTTVSQGTLVAGADAVSTTIASVTAPVTLATDVYAYSGAPPVDPLQNGQKVWLGGAPTFTPTLPAFTPFYVINATGTSFQLSQSDGGAPVDATAGGTATTFNRYGVFGSTNSPVVMGDADTGSNDIALLTGGPFTIERAVNVTANGSGTSTIGGSTDDNSTFSGAISLAKNVRLTSTASGANKVNVSGVISSSGAFGVTKVGAGNATLSAANTYSGTTNVDSGLLTASGASATFGTGNATVTGGILEIASGVANAIANSATLSLAGGGTPSFADIGYAILGTGINEQVNALILNGMNKPVGTYGSTLSSAMFKDDEYFSGDGIITVALAALPGDFNLDGKVNAADYVVWRKSPGSFPVDAYATWRANFGNPPGSGSSLGGDSAAVPEPGAIFLVMIGLGLAASRRRVRVA